MSENGARKVRECEQRYLGDRRCPDCNLFCRRVDIGGACPSCDELVALTDLAQPAPHHDGDD